jgi:hypothetical protein
VGVLQFVGFVKCQHYNTVIDYCVTKCCTNPRLGLIVRNDIRNGNWPCDVVSGGYKSSMGRNTVQGKGSGTGSGKLVVRREMH